VNDCIFCKIIAGELPSETIDSDERTITVLDINPATDGHVVVFPREHAENLFDLPDEDLLATMVAARRVGEQMKKTLAPDGFNILNNTGRAAWQSVFHFHVHVIPRYAGDPLQLPWVPGPADPAHLSEIATRLRG
jgi:histidine triad (HIT) family protein